jgi:uncharacterized protein (TIGR03083 family)
MTLDLATYTDTITAHSDGVAAAASGHLDEPIEHCPGWTMVDLIQHLTEVQWFWATVVEQRLQERPQDGRPTDIDRSELIERFSRGAQHLARVLEDTDQSTRVYTWAPRQQDVAFVTRHQVQEIVVHHWDAAHAAGVDFFVDPAVAADSIEEFLTFSVSNDDDPIDPPGVTLGGSLGFKCSDVDRSWTVVDGDTQSTVRFVEGVEADTPLIEGTSSDILLWLYSRVELESDEPTAELARRFRELCFTD